MSTTTNQAPKDAVVRVHNVEKRSTPVVVNRRQVDVPHNQDFPLAGPYVEALQNSRVNMTVVRDLEQGEVPAGADAAESTAPADDAGNGQFNQVQGGDALRHAPPQTAAGLVVHEGGAIDQTPGGDNLAHAGAVGLATTGEERALAEEAATDATRAVAEGTIEPAVVITRVEGAPATAEIGAGLADAAGATETAARDPLDRDNKDGKGGSVSYATILEGTVPEVLTAAEALAPDQRKRLLEAEKKGQGRKGITDALSA